MATKKKGILTSSPEWWKHLRWIKRPFWKGERQAVKEDIKKTLRDETGNDYEPYEEYDWREW
jgi:hypothetical protein